MTSAAAQQKRIEKLWKKWCDRLGMYGWDVTRTYHDGPYIQADGLNSDGGVASTSARWQYKHGAIAFDVTQTAKLSDERLEYVVVHEIMHIWLNEMRSDGLDHEERVATELAWAFLRTELS